jgi:hypothetical protein
MKILKKLFIKIFTSVLIFALLLIFIFLFLQKDKFNIKNSELKSVFTGSGYDYNNLLNSEQESVCTQTKYWLFCDVLIYPTSNNMAVLKTVMLKKT